MAVLAWLLGWLGGWLLFWRLPTLSFGDSNAAGGTTTFEPPEQAGGEVLSVAVVVPARDEAGTIATVLASLRAQRRLPAEVVVVDDGSTDATASIAEAAGVRVVPAPEPPLGWTGKAWACHTGVAATAQPLLCLLDADVELHPSALEALVAAHRQRGGLVSVLPRHVPVEAYEQLSAPCNVVSVMGSGAAAVGADGRCDTAFGPCVVVGRADLERLGGFAAVAGEVVEDIALARRAVAAGLPVTALGGGAAVAFRMYPAGPAQLVEGWTKNMAAGAVSTPPLRSAVVAAWVASALAPTAVLVRHGPRRPWAWLGLAAAMAQFAVLARSIGRFRWWVGPAQPVLMGGFVALFVRSAWHRWVLRRTTWRGRPIAFGDPGRGVGAGAGSARVAGRGAGPAGVAGRGVSGPAALAGSTAPAGPTAAGAGPG